MKFSGYDYLALNAFVKKGDLKSIETQIGIGKESDIYLCRNKDDKLIGKGFLNFFIEWCF